MNYYLLVSGIALLILIILLTTIGLLAKNSELVSIAAGLFYALILQSR